MPKFRKKPVVVEAVRFDGENVEAIEAFVGKALEQKTCSDGCLVIPTLEGQMTASPGDWIIKGVKGEFYPCKPDIFAATYDLEATPDPIYLDAQTGAALPPSGGGL